MTASRAGAIAAVVGAVGEPTRMRLLDELAPGPAALGELVGRTGLRAANLAHHLGVLRAAGIVAQARRGRSVEYRLDGRVYRAGASGGRFLSVEGWVIEVGRRPRPAG